MSTTLPAQPQTREPRPVEPPPVVSVAPAPIKERLLSLDVFRGLTIAGMLLVNDPGSWGAIYPPLEHATWNGWTPTDLIFPFFLFIVGITTHLSISSRRARGADDSAIRRQIIRRGALIFLIGLLINGFPYFTWNSPDQNFLHRFVDRLEHWRIMGVLQRIGLAYIAAALLTLRTSLKQQILILAGLLYGYWLVMTIFPVPDSGALGAIVLNVPEHTMAAYWDRVFLDWSRFDLGNHLWVSSQTWDPEGVLSTIPAVGTAMLGVFAGRWIGATRPLSERLSALFAAGAIAMSAGLVWNWAFPINKSIWTSSYVLFTAGMAAVSLATIMWLVDVHRLRGWTKPFVIYGTNPIIAFAGSGVMARCIYSIFKVSYDGQPISLQAAIYRSMFLSWLSPVNASLAFAICFVLLWLGISWMLYRKNIFLKV